MRIIRFFLSTAGIIALLVAGSISRYGVAVASEGALSATVADQKFITLGLPCELKIEQPENMAEVWVEGLPSGLYYNKELSAISGVPEFAGTYSIQICHSTASGIAQRTLSIQVTENPAPPPVPQKDSGDSDAWSVYANIHSGCIILDPLQKKSHIVNLPPNTAALQITVYSLFDDYGNPEIANQTPPGNIIFTKSGKFSIAVTGGDKNIREINQDYYAGFGSYGGIWSDFVVPLTNEQLAKKATTVSLFQRHVASYGIYSIQIIPIIARKLEMNKSKTLIRPPEGEFFYFDYTKPSWAKSISMAEKSYLAFEVESIDRKVHGTKIPMELRYKDEIKTYPVKTKSGDLNQASGGVYTNYRGGIRIPAKEAKEGTKFRYKMYIPGLSVDKIGSSATTYRITPRQRIVATGDLATLYNKEEYKNIEKYTSHVYSGDRPKALRAQACFKAFIAALGNATLGKGKKPIVVSAESIYRPYERCNLMRFTHRYFRINELSVPEPKLTDINLMKLSDSPMFSKDNSVFSNLNVSRLKSPAEWPNLQIDWYQDGGSKASGNLSSLRAVYNILGTKKVASVSDHTQGLALDLSGLHSGTALNESLKKRSVKKKDGTAVILNSWSDLKKVGESYSLSPHGPGDMVHWKYSGK